MAKLTPLNIPSRTILPSTVDSQTTEQARSSPVDASPERVDPCEVGNYETAKKILDRLEQQQLSDPEVAATMAQAYASLALVDAINGMTTRRTGRHPSPDDDVPAARLD